jgi:hypothetical protein
MLAILISTLLANAATKGEIDECISSFNQHAVHEIPALDADQTAALMRGEVVRTLFQAPDPNEPSAVVAFVLSPVPRNQLWIAAQDPHTQVDPGLTEKVIEPLGADRAVWYGHWDLPRPLRDRQWVVESGNTHAVAHATSGKGWEHTWELVPDGLGDARPVIADGQIAGITLAHLESALFTPINRGSWFMFELDDGQTLLGYQATSVVGGAIPTWLVSKLVMARMESVLRGLETRAKDWSAEHYCDGHTPVYGGDGEPIPHF